MSIFYKTTNEEKKRLAKIEEGVFLGWLVGWFAVGFFVVVCCFGWFWFWFFCTNSGNVNVVPLQNNWRENLPSVCHIYGHTFTARM